MPQMNVNNVNLNYIDTGNGDEVLVFSHGFLFSNEMFNQQIDYLKSKFRIIAFDHRGQGESEITKTGYTLENLVEDAKQLIESLKLGKVHFIGLSMGGFVGLRLACWHPEMVKTLTILESSADKEETASKLKYKVLGAVVKLFGFKIVCSSVMKILYGKTFLKDQARKDERAQWKNFLLNRNVSGSLKTLKGFTARNDFSEQLHNIKCPTMVLIGEEDVATPLKYSDKMNNLIPNSKLVKIPEAGHSSPIENPEFVSKAIEEFIMNQK